jgi:hypothetical protein
VTWKRFNWLSDGAIPLLVALLRVLWLAPWLELVRQWAAPSAHAPVLSLGVMLAFMLCSMLAARLAAGRLANLALARGVLVVCAFVAILFVLWRQFYSAHSGFLEPRWLTAMADEMGGWEGSLPASLLAVPLLLYMWLQGTVDGQRALDRDETWRAFTVGFVALALCATVSFAAGQGIPAGLSNLVLIFFAAGMAALALSSLETTRGYASGKGEGQIAVDRYWLISVASVIVVLLVAGLLLSVLLTPDVVARLLAWTSGVMDLLGKLLYYVLLVFAYLIFALLQPLINLLQSHVREKNGEQTLQLPDYKEQLEQVQRGAATLPPEWGAVLRWLGLVLFLVIIGLIFALALRRLQRRKDESSDETRESILTRDLLSRQLSGLLRGRLRRWQGRAAQAFSPFLALDGEQETRRQVRQIYQSFLAVMSERGRKRERSQTPAEFERTVQSDVAQEQAALAILTDSYVQARYAAHPPQRSRVEPVRQAWQRLHALLVPPQK